jgi:hypothetical protein
VLRKAVILSVLAGLFATPAQAARSLLMPRVTYERQVQFTSHGPVAIHVLSAPRPGGLWGIKPVLSNGAIVGRERVTAMQRTAMTAATVAGVNGDLFSAADGRPTGVLMQDSVLHSPPSAERSSAGFTADGTMYVDRVRLFGTWQGSGQRRPLTLNQPPGPNGVSLYTSAWGPATPVLDGVTEAVLAPFPPATPNADLVAPVTEIRPGRGGTAIPPGSAVLVTRGTSAQRLVAEAPAGVNVTVRLRLSPDWSGIVDAIGGGPVLVRQGKPVFRHNELFSTAQLARNPRTGVGQLADGRILLVVVDGRQPGYSVGMTNFELAQTLVRLGAVTGMGLDAGGSSTMAFDGTLLNRPSDPGGERAVSEGLFVFYWGIYAAPAAEPVVSPNGDGVAEAQRLSYKVVRPSNVTVDLVGPDRVARRLEEGPKQPGTYTLDWTGVAADGTPEPEGTWRFAVTGVDDQGQSSNAERVFSLNRTLGALRVSPALLRAGARNASLRATFTLTRPARVTASVETSTGAVYAVVARRDLQPGTRTIAWNGLAGKTVAHTGRYVLRISAANTVGRVDLRAPFLVRKVAPSRR